MAKSRRVEKFSALIRKEISELLIYEIRDERVNQSMITITEVEVSSDLQYCKIFVSLFGEEKTKSDVINGLEAAKGFLRGELARRLQMRRAPELVFKLDNAMAKGITVLSLLSKLEEERKTKNIFAEEDDMK